MNETNRISGPAISPARETYGAQNNPNKGNSSQGGAGETPSDPEGKQNFDVELKRAMGETAIEAAIAESTLTGSEKNDLVAEPSGTEIYDGEGKLIKPPGGNVNTKA